MQKLLLLLSNINNKRKDFVREVKFSNSFRDDKETLQSQLLIESHVLEKGITMPSRREGFGYEKVRSIICKCRSYIVKYGANGSEVQAAIADLSQYYDIHMEAKFQIPRDIEDGILELRQYLQLNDDNCFMITKEKYFSLTNSYEEFAKQRHSIRDYSSEIVDKDVLFQAIKLAQTCPSACNRQSVRIKIIEDKDVIKEICENIQSGNRGFGQLADKWLLITSEMGAWSHSQISMAYIDGGIFTMSLLNALHYYGICACTLNAHLSYAKQKRLSQLLKYPLSEIPIVFVAIGMPKNEFMIAKSRRKEMSEIVSVI